MKNENISLLEGRKLAQALDDFADIFKHTDFPKELVFEILSILRKMAMSGALPARSVGELTHLLEETINEQLEKLTAPEKPALEQKPKEPAIIPQSYGINQPVITPIIKPQESVDEIFPQVEIMEKPTFVIGEFANKQKEIKDISNFTLITNNLLRVLRDPEHRNCGLEESTYDALIRFIDKNEVGELSLKEESLGSLTTDEIHGCVLGRPSSGFALIKSRRVRDYEILAPWPNFSTKLLKRVIDTEGIEPSEVSDIIYIAAPIFGITQVVFYKIPYKNHKT